jgi:putative ABC transport system permease protein
MVSNTDVKTAWKGVVGGRWGSLAAVLALALGIGATLTAGAVAYAGLLRPLPFANGHELVTLQKLHVPTAVASGVRLVDFDTWQSGLAGTVRVAGVSSAQVTLRNAGAPQQVQINYVTGPFFDTLGVRALAGRMINERDEFDAALVSQSFARRLAGSDAAAIDRTLVAGTRTLRIVGVVSDALRILGGNADVWASARSADGVMVLGDTDRREYLLIGRLQAGRSLADARADGERFLMTQTPDAQKTNWHIQAKTLRDMLMGDSRTVVLAFAAAASLVLLVACANVAMLLVNRAVSRGREFALRLALGATRGRLFTTALLEAAILATLGAALGIAFARAAITFLQQESGLDIPRVATMTSMAPIALGAVAAVCLVIVVCGVVPTLILRQRNLVVSLRAPNASGSRVSRRLRGALVVAQLATAIVLLTGAGLLGRTLLHLAKTDYGLDGPERVVALSLPIGESSRPDAASRAALIEDILQRTRRLPGVVTAGVGGNLPPAAGSIIFTVRYSSDARDETKKFDLVPGTDGYLDALGARVVRGRLFEPADLVSAQSVAVLSESALKHLGGTADIVGKDLNMALPAAGGPRVKPRVIGVIKDIRYAGLDVPASGGIYILWRQAPIGRAYLIARVTRDPEAIAPAIAAVVREADPSIPLAGARTLDAEVERSLAPRSSRFGLVGVFAVAATLLAVVGLSGALIRSVMERQRELAIRSAIGATPRTLVRSVLRQGTLLAAAGIAIGVGASLLAGRAASAMLYGVSPYDPVTYAATVAGVLAVTLAACYLPARRAASVDPILLLRSE